MIRNIVSILFFAMVLTVLPCGAHAQLPDSLVVEFDFEGFGNAILNSPPLYSGDVIAGDPLVVGGSWWIRIDDSGWPAPGDPQARWDYVFGHFFTHDPSSFSWTGVFDDNSCPTKPVWELSHATNGTMGGTLILVLTYTDWNMNGVLDVEERMLGVFSGTLIIMKYGTGLFAGYCGLGAYNGAVQNPDPANWADEYVDGHCKLDLKDCRIGTHEVSWSAIKGLYR
jgi:hypothetical protein